MTLDETRFATLAGDKLEAISDAVDEALGDRIDVDFNGGILTMTLPGGGQYVINKHGPNREIWLSSPASGAWHFAYADDAWISTREPKAVLDRLLVQELKDRFGVEVAI
ncbi:MAG: iron donor protein CyaY [Magnetospirillum sp.]|nr:iron donor protein CyaY [Magnetospirillum sp.]